MNIFWKVVQDRPNQIATTIRAIFAGFVLFGVPLTQEQIGGLLAIVESVLGLFQYAQTLPKGMVEQRVDEKVAHREMAGTTGTGNGMSKS